MIPKIAIFWPVVTAVWIWVKNRLDAFYLWSVAIAALALANSHVILRIDLESGHWRMVWGPAELLVIVAAVESMRSRLGSAVAVKWRRPLQRLYS